VYGWLFHCPSTSVICSADRQRRPQLNCHGWCRCCCSWMLMMTMMMMMECQVSTLPSGGQTNHFPVLLLLFYITPLCRVMQSWPAGCWRCSRRLEWPKGKINATSNVLPNWKSALESSVMFGTAGIGNPFDAIQSVPNVLVYWRCHYAYIAIFVMQFQSINQSINF